jgi:hypothetical protein
MTVPDLEEMDDQKLCARVHVEVFGRSVLALEPGTVVDGETGEPVPDYVSDPMTLFGRFDEWGFQVFVREGETLEDGSEGVSVVAEHPSRSTVIRQAEGRGRAYCEAAVEIVRTETGLTSGAGDE